MWLCFAWCLAACRIHGNAEKGERVAKQVLEQEPEKMMQVMYVLISNMYVCSWCQLGSPGEGWMTKKGKRIEETTEERIQEVRPWSCNVPIWQKSCKLCSLKHYSAGLCPPNLHGNRLWPKTNKSGIIWLYTFFMHPFKCLRASLAWPCIAYPPIMAFQSLASCWTLSEHHPGFHIWHTCPPSYSPQKLPDSQTLWRIYSWAHLTLWSAPGLAHAWTAPVQNKQSLNAHLPVAFVEIVPMPVALACISHIPISWQFNWPHLNMDALVEHSLSIVHAPTLSINVNQATP